MTIAVVGIFSAITKCRTSELGGHTDICENCGSVRISYNSCRNRHCPIGKWVNSRKKFLLPIKVLSLKFKGKFLALLKVAKLEFHNNANPYAFADLIDSCYKKEWIVYCKPPFKTAACVVEYLGRYTHRVAISNNRILSIKNGLVTFKWRDYKDNSKKKIMTITAEEFIRRFLMHILPQGFMKIRHYGFLGNRNKLSKLKICKIQTHTPIIQKIKISTLELVEKLLGRSVRKCPDCGSERIVRCGLSPPALAN